MTTFATGLFKSVTLKAETTFGVLPSNSGGQYLRRVQSTLDPNIQVFNSQEINQDRQLRDSRHGPLTIRGTLAGEISPGTYSSMFAAQLAGAPIAGVTSGDLTNITAAAGPPGTFTRAAGSFITDGFKIGNIVRFTGWTTGSSSWNNNRNYRITGLTATVMTVGTAATGATGEAESVVAQASGDTVNVTVVGKTMTTPLAGNLLDPSFAVEHWFEDISQSEVYLGNKVGATQVNLPPAGLATCSFTWMGRSVVTDTAQYFTNPTALTTSGITAASNGSLRIQNTDVAYISGLTFTMNGNYATVPVVGTNLTPGVFPGQILITGQFTALFANQAYYNDAMNETEINLLSVLTTSDAVNANFVSFELQRIKLNQVTKDDKQGPITQTIPFTALLNVAGGSGTNGYFSTMTIQDSLA